MADHEKTPLTMASQFSAFMDHRPGTLEKIAKRLDREMKAVKNWRHFAWELNVDASVIEQWNWYGNFSPTIRVFEHLDAVQPDLTVLKVKNALRDIGREDLRDCLREVNDSDKACDAITPTLLKKMESGLDRSDRIVGNWYKFALRLGISKEDCQQFETRLLDYPTCKLFQYLTTKNTKLTLEELEKELRSIKRNNLANILREVIKREGNKLVKDVITPQSDLLGKISNELDRNIVGTGNWCKLAYKLGIPREVYEEFSDPKGQDKPSPTIGIIEKVVKERPSITIFDVVEVLTRIKRMDVKEEIENVVSGTDLTSEMSKLRVNLDDEASKTSEDKVDAAEVVPSSAPAPEQAPAPTPTTSSSSTAAAAAAAAAPVASNSPQVFLSYQWDLQSIVKNLKERLEGNGISCWMDLTDMGPGDSLRAEIADGIRNCTVFISCMNKKYCEESKLCPLEATLAHERGKRIIPLLLEDIKPWPPEGKLALVFTDLIYSKETAASGVIPEEKFAVLLKQVQKYI